MLINLYAANVTKTAMQFGLTLPGRQFPIGTPPAVHHSFSPITLF
jgi:hypothetical protein